jgi:Asp-tRNA(Asn)/Glu-tRNA(Gln) amidotransferase C subunit
MGKYLARQFPQYLAQIAELRICDPEFDEICGQFEEVAALLEECSQTSSGPWEPLKETLADLQREIADCLGAENSG